MNQFKAVVADNIDRCECCDAEIFCFKTAIGTSCGAVIKKVLKTNKYYYAQNNHYLEDRLTKKLKTRRF